MTVVQSAPSTVSIGDLLVLAKVYYRVTAVTGNFAVCTGLKDGDSATLLAGAFIGYTKRKGTATWLATTAPKAAPVKAAPVKAAPVKAAPVKAAPVKGKGKGKASPHHTAKMLESIAEDIHALSDTSGQSVASIVAALLELTFDESWRMLIDGAES